MLYKWGDILFHVFGGPDSGVLQPPLESPTRATRVFRGRRGLLGPSAMSITATPSHERLTKHSRLFRGKEKILNTGRY